MMELLQRSPSSTWEPVPLPEFPEPSGWFWFRPPAAPNGLVFQIPPQTWQATGGHLSVRGLAAAIGLDVRLIHAWTVQGVTVPGLMGTNPLLDHPLPPPRPGV